MSLTPEEFEKKLQLLLAGELADSQLAGLENFAAQDAGALYKLDQVQRLRAALRQSAREYRRTTYPGNLVSDLAQRMPSQRAPTIRRRRWVYALAAILIVASTLTLILRDRPATSRIATGRPSITIVAAINQELSRFKRDHHRQLAEWSRSATLGSPAAGALKITGIMLPDRPTLNPSIGTSSQNQKGVKL